MPNLAGHYEPPFCPATTAGLPQMCICCGHCRNAEQKISEYPFRFIPKGWSISAQSQGLRCDSCTRDKKVKPRFYENNDVWMHEEASYGYGDAKKFTLTTVSRQSYTQTETAQDQVHVRITDAGVPYYEDGEGRRYIREDQQTMPATHEDPDEAIAPAPTRGQRLKNQAGEVGGAFGAGLQLAAANETGEILIDIAKEMADELPMIQLALEHPDGREIAKVLVALMLHTGVNQTSFIPQGEFIGEACKLQMTASSFTLVAPRLNKLRKHFTKLAKIGEQATIANGMAHKVRVYTQEEMDDAYAEMEGELADLKARMAITESPSDNEPEEPEEVAAPAPKNGKRRGSTSKPKHKRERS